MTETTTISVSGDAGYNITVGRGILDHVGESLAPTVRKVLVVHPPTLGAEQGHCLGVIARAKWVLGHEASLRLDG